MKPTVKTEEKKYRKQAKYRAKQMALGMCIYCGNKAVIKQFCQLHREIHNAAQRRQYLAKRGTKDKSVKTIQEEIEKVLEINYDPDMETLDKRSIVKSIMALFSQQQQKDRKELIEELEGMKVPVVVLLAYSESDEKGAIASANYNGAIDRVIALVKGKGGNE